MLIFLSSRNFITFKRLEFKKGKSSQWNNITIPPHIFWLCICEFDHGGQETYTKSGILRHLKAGVSNWHFAGRMRPLTCSVRPATKTKIRKCPKITKFLDYFRKIRPLNTFFGLYAARENIFYQNVALEDIWVWDPCLKVSKQ
jgi:hypothetical protein